MKTLLLSFILGWVAHGAPAPEKSVIHLSEPYPVVGYLERSGKVITLKAGPSGTLFSVQEKGGAVLAENLTEAQLLADKPELYALLRKAMADETPGAFIDASVGDSPARPPSGIPWQIPSRTDDGEN